MSSPYRPHRALYKPSRMNKKRIKRFNNERDKRQPKGAHHKVAQITEKLAEEFDNVSVRDIIAQNEPVMETMSSEPGGPTILPSAPEVGTDADQVPSVGHRKPDHLTNPPDHLTARTLCTSVIEPNTLAITRGGDVVFCQSEIHKKLKRRNGECIDSASGQMAVRCRDNSTYCVYMGKREGWSVSHTDDHMDIIFTLPRFAYKSLYDSDVLPSIVDVMVVVLRLHKLYVEERGELHPKVVAKHGKLAAEYHGRKVPAMIIDHIVSLAVFDKAEIASRRKKTAYIGKGNHKTPKHRRGSFFTDGLRNKPSSEPHTDVLDVTPEPQPEEPKAEEPPARPAGQPEREAWIGLADYGSHVGRVYSELESTALRLCSETSVKKIKVYYRDGMWYGPILLMSPSPDDIEEQKRLDQIVTRESIIEKAKSLGLTEEELEILRGESV